ncbi:Maf family nucleotide pyrophosphatase [Anaplasma capra]|uniref:Maf family nucleotide pyrophosphatase n=1 Tax=Anaplasma capra TaxID=1562740 RepID=UPI0021D57E1B|nr:Maf family nucleotide pyrophosphatase [Anaplasma capra]MCU7611558.1 Maf family nucleotide pyrophosphatase [Anaplasma capra]MCU7612003.1 Maf family nucleotide pyrophosphatase [Anaplasma capra]
MLKIDSLVLASSSKYRLGLLGQLGVIPGEVVPPDVDEGILKGELPRQYCIRMARDKTAKVAALRSGRFVLGADTVAYCGRRVLFKTEDKDRAMEYLEMLSGRRHRVCTAVCLYAPGGLVHERSVVSVVKFKSMSKSEMDFYVDSGQWKGKAGGYGIQGLAGALISWIQGSYSSIVGLPLHETYCLLSSYFDLKHIP